MTDTAPDTGTDPTTDTADDGDKPDNLQSEVDKWKAQARKHEERAKANAAAQKELDALKAQHMTDTEKAIATAKAEGRVEALAEAGAKIARAEFKAAVGDRLDAEGFEALLEGLDLKAFLDDNGDVDASKIGAFVDRIAPKADAGFQVPDLGQGSRADSKAMALNGDPLLRDLKQKLGIR